jgi:hypothetical protein
VFKALKAQDHASKHDVARLLSTPTPYGVHYDGALLTKWLAISGARH